MQGPFAAFAVDPGGGVARQPGDEVSALRFVAVPPAALDAFLPGEQREFRLGQAARLFQQPQRSRARQQELALIPFARLNAPPGMLGPVIGLRGEPADCRATQADSQALEQPRPVFLLASRIAEQAAAARPERREIGCAQLDRLDWLLKFFLVKSFPQEDGQTRGIPGYGSEPDVEFLGRGIEMDQAQREGADALMSRSEQAFELG